MDTIYERSMAIFVRMDKYHFTSMKIVSLINYDKSFDHIVFNF